MRCRKSCAYIGCAICAGLQWTIHFYRRENVTLQGKRACWWNLSRCCFLWLWVIQGQMGWLLRSSPQGGCVLYLFVSARSILCFLGLPVLYRRSWLYPFYIVCSGWSIVGIMMECGRMSIVKQDPSIT